MIALFHEALKDVLPVIENSAPILASALGSPIAGVAIKFLEESLGIKDASIDEVQNAITKDPDISTKLNSAQESLWTYLKSNINLTPPTKINFSVALEWT